MSVSPNFRTSAFLTSAGERHSATDLDMSSWSSEVALCCIGWRFMGEDAIPRPSAPSIYRLIDSGHFRLLSEVSAAIRNEIHFPACSTSGRQTVRSLGIAVALTFRWKSCRGGIATRVVLVVPLVRVYYVFRSCVLSVCCET